MSYLISLLVILVGSLNLRFVIISPDYPANDPTMPLREGFGLWVFMTLVRFLLSLLVITGIIVLTPLTFSMFEQTCMMHIFAISVALAVNLLCCRFGVALDLPPSDIPQKTFANFQYWGIAPIIGFVFACIGFVISFLAAIGVVQ